MSNYWFLRIDIKNRNFLKEETKQGRLRQGWGWDESHDLRNNPQNKYVKRNLSAFQKVKKGDVIIVPRLQSHHDLSIVEATADWDDSELGYKFKQHPEHKDYRHIFPVRFVKSIQRHHPLVGSGIKKSLLYRGRFWTAVNHKQNIDAILNSNDDLMDNEDVETATNRIILDTFADTFDEERYKTELVRRFLAKFYNAEWETVLQSLFSCLYPNALVEVTTNKSEKKHGADLFIIYDGPLKERKYVIAVQVKDHKGITSKKPINQVLKSDDYFSNIAQDAVLIDKLIIFTEISNQDGQNQKTLDEANRQGVTLVFREDLEELIFEAAKKLIAQNSS